MCVCVCVRYCVCCGCGGAVEINLALPKGTSDAVLKNAYSPTADFALVATDKLRLR